MSYYPDPELSEDAIIYKIVYCSSLACTCPTSKCEHSEISNNIVRFFIKRNTTKFNNTYSPSTVTFVMARWKRKSVSTYSFFHLHKARCNVALSERTPSIRPSQGRGGPLHAIFVASGITHQVRPNSLHRKVTVPTSHYTARHEWVLLSITQSDHHSTTCRMSSVYHQRAEASSPLCARQSTDFPARTPGFK